MAKHKRWNGGNDNIRRGAVAADIEKSARFVCRSGDHTRTEKQLRKLRNFRSISNDLKQLYDQILGLETAIDTYLAAPPRSVADLEILVSFGKFGIGTAIIEPARSLLKEIVHGEIARCMLAPQLTRSAALAFRHSSLYESNHRLLIGVTYHAWP